MQENFLAQKNQTRIEENNANKPIKQYSFSECFKIKTVKNHKFFKYDRKCKIAYCFYSYIWYNPNYPHCKDADNDFKNFINKISSQSTEKYRLLAEFNDSTYATIRYGE